MKKNVFNQYIQEADFKGLFITEMGWNRFHGQAELMPIYIGETAYSLTTVAERNGFQVFSCPVTAIPSTTICRQLDSKLRRNAHDYICTFYIPRTEHQLWIAPIKTVEKRDIVTIEYESADKADFLFSKIDGLSFGIDERTTIVDVKERIQGAFAVNSEKITKDFYAGFRKEHKAFAAFITGIDDQLPASDNRNKQWYASVMLNRLMFCYFIQKKGFLDGNYDYLQVKLKQVQQERGENRFFKTFYRGFLSELFHDGLNSPNHNDAFENKYGRIPYLNGGMFDEHQLERDYANIDICDEAFTRLFKFFDMWRWHLDTRITASGKDINPDVLGYIFEQYINDRAQMGAYYTKEDITEYISKNCILPFLMDKAAEASPEAFKADGYVWRTLRESRDRYVYDAVKKGYTPDWREQIPADIAKGLDTTQPDLLARRKDWNTKTPEAFALPTEIWRETVERLQRCEQVLAKIKEGEITHINDFITYNLDIRSFVYDLLQRAEDHRFILHFYKALQCVTILDPTCGSGAFLFAAMNILEPLYEVCIGRMEEFHTQNPRLFKAELDEIAHKYHSNIQYFIYKSIILRNLYGVDIMVEATEIAKLRLFLKMMAVVEANPRADNLGLDPLPDIDFNIRCGNTLVGYATEEELNKDLTWGDMFANQEFKEKVETEMQLVATAYEAFKHVQFTQSEDMAAFKRAKQDLKTRLTALNESLNHRLHRSTTDLPYDKWLATHQPFHWLAEFYQIIHDNGGFDVIIGNPPYVEYSKVQGIYKVYNYKTIPSGNLYSFVIERSVNIIGNQNYLGMIIPISAFCTDRMESLMDMLLQNSLITYISNYAERPGKLFEGAERNLAIALAQLTRKHQKICNVYTTRYYKWKSENRNLLFSCISYFNTTKVILPANFTKIGYQCEYGVLKKLRSITSNIGYYTQKSKSQFILYYKNSGGRYWKFMATFKPIFYLNNVKGTSSRETHLYFDNADKLKVFTAILNSSLYYWFYVMHSDTRTNNPSDLKNFPIKYEELHKATITQLEKYCDLLMDELQRNSIMVNAKYRTGDVEFAQYLPAKSKNLIDEIDKILAQHYGFTEEELDFIINYDIKYRMGDELNEE